MTTNVSPSIDPSIACIDSAEVIWAADEIAAILRKSSPDSIVEAVLQQTLRELNSLKQSAATNVVGPLRLKAA